MTDPLMTPRIQKRSSTRRKKYKYRNLLVDIDSKNRSNEIDQKDEEEIYTFDQFLQMVNKFEFQKNEEINLRTKNKQDRSQNDKQQSDKVFGGKLALNKTLSIQLPLLNKGDESPIIEKFMFLTANKRQLGSRYSAKRSQIEKNQNQKEESIFTEQNKKKQRSEGDRSDNENVKMSVLSNRSSNTREQINEYEILKTLGSGGFSKVMQCMNIETKQIFAMKQIRNKHLRKKLPMKNNQLVADDLINNEIALLKKLEHPNIVKLFEVIEDKEKNTFYLILQYCSGGYINQLQQIQQNDPQSPVAQGRYKKLFESQCKRLYQQLSLAIDYIHNVAKIAHRDIKPENILLHQGQVKLTDFGLSTQQIQVSSGSGTKGYLPPQSRNKGMLSSKKPKTPISPNLLPEVSHNLDGSNISNFIINVMNVGKVTAQMGDIWSLGITLIVLLRGKLQVIQDQKIQQHINGLKDVSSECKDFLQKCLKIEPKERITAQQILDHPWIRVKKTSSYHQIYISQVQKVAAIVERTKNK